MTEAQNPSQFYIPARTSLDPDATSRLKSGDTFAVFDAGGDVLGFEGNTDGLYHHDTRHLSHFEMRLNGARPLLLSSSMRSDNAALIVDVTNPDFFERDKLRLAKDTLHIQRTKFLWNDAAYERFAIFNFDEAPFEIGLSFVFDADFADLFEARGQRRPARGSVEPLPPKEGRLAFLYRGLDQVVRYTAIAFHPAPTALDRHSATYRLTLAPRRRHVIFVRVGCEPRLLEEPWDDRAFRTAMIQSRRTLRRAAERAPRLRSSSNLLDEMLTRARSDLTMLVTDTPQGPYPYAGVPWFSTAFGRDGIITALFTLWSDPSIARGVLGYLAQNQATEIDPFRDAEPGKILHETRACEMAALNEIPFGRYYGSIDATPLFVMLAGAYLERTGDLDFLRGIYPNIKAALSWIETYGDRDGDGFVEYARQRETGLSNQGWKDSWDSVFHADGSLAEGPIALCEVQAYVYGAWRAAAALARALGDAGAAATWNGKAEALRHHFEEAFWLEDLGTYALALDGLKSPCRVISSNAGHALYTGIAAPERAARVAATLVHPDGFSGWGIRTIARGAARYNPMSYHNGSIWPHDNGIIALGFARYGFKPAVSQVFQGLAGAASYIPLIRLPELFCGFERPRRRGPTAYPVACAPHAWAAVTPFALVAASLGLTLDHATREIRLVQPVLPAFVDHLGVAGLTLGAGAVDLEVTRQDSSVAVAVKARRGEDIRVAVVH